MDHVDDNMFMTIKNWKKQTVVLEANSRTNTSLHSDSESKTTYGVL